MEFALRTLDAGISREDVRLDFSRSGRPTKDPNNELFYRRLRAEWLNLLVD